jgi:hypothetical protein
MWLCSHRLVFFGAQLKRPCLTMMVTTFYNTFYANINIKPNLKLKLWLWKGDLVDVIMCEKLTLSQTNLDNPNFKHPTSLTTTSLNMMPMGSRSQNFPTNIFPTIHHAIITCNIHNACCLRPFPLIPHWIPSNIIETKFYGVNSYEIPENKKQNKVKLWCLPCFNAH